MKPTFKSHITNRKPRPHRSQPPRRGFRGGFFYRPPHTTETTLAIPPTTSDPPRLPIHTPTDTTQKTPPKYERNPQANTHLQTQTPQKISDYSKKIKQPPKTNKKTHLIYIKRHKNTQKKQKHPTHHPPHHPKRRHLGTAWTGKKGSPRKDTHGSHRTARKGATGRARASECGI